MNLLALYTDFSDKLRNKRVFSYWKKYNDVWVKNAKIPIKKLTNKQQKEVDDFWFECLGASVEYDSCELYSSFTNSFDPAYVPRYLYFALIEYALNNSLEYVRVLEDKNLLNTFAGAAGVASPKTYWKNVNGLNQDAHSTILSKEDICSALAQHDKVFVKPTIGSAAGDNCTIFHTKDLSSEELRALVDSMLKTYKTNFVVQECVQNSEELKEIHPWSLNTVRVVTYLLDGEVKHMPGVLRMGRNKAIVDNASAGGILVGIQDDGKLCDYAFTDKFDYKTLKHPDTDYVFSEHTISSYPKILEAAHALHASYPQVGIINWDFTLNAEDEPCLIEVNGEFAGGFDLVQIGHGQGCFGDDTKRIVSICKTLCNLPKTERDRAYKKGILTQRKLE